MVSVVESKIVERAWHDLLINRGTHLPAVVTFSLASFIVYCNYSIV
jgi:hypothetical protein